MKLTDIVDVKSFRRFCETQVDILNTDLARDRAEVVASVERMQPIVATFVLYEGGRVDFRTAYYVLLMLDKYLQEEVKAC